MSKEAGHDPFVTSEQREASRHRQVTSQPVDLATVQGHVDVDVEDGAKGAGGYSTLKGAGHGRPAAGT